MPGSAGRAPVPVSGSSRAVIPPDKWGGAHPTLRTPRPVPFLHLVTDDDVLAQRDFEARARAILATATAIPGAERSAGPSSHGVAPTSGARAGDGTRGDGTRGDGTRDDGDGGAANPGAGRATPDVRAAGPAPGDATLAPGAPAATGPLALHLRGPRTPGRRLFDLAAALLPAAEAVGALLLVNDRVDVAGAVGAHGAHLGRRSLPVSEVRALLGPDAWIGASVHGAGEVDALEALPNFLIVGALYSTASHPGRTGAGPDRLREVAGAVEAAGARAGAAAGASRPLPLIGIGGVTPERIPEVQSAGASGVAVLSGVWGARDPAAAVARYRAAWDGS